MVSIALSFGSTTLRVLIPRSSPWLPTPSWPPSKAAVGGRAHTSARSGEASGFLSSGSAAQDSPGSSPAILRTSLSQSTHRPPAAQTSSYSVLPRPRMGMLQFFFPRKNHSTRKPFISWFAPTVTSKE